MVVAFVHCSPSAVLKVLCPAQAYAFAVLGYQPGERLLSAVAKGVQWQLRDFSPQACYPCPQAAQGFSQAKRP